MDRTVPLPNSPFGTLIEEVRTERLERCSAGRARVTPADTADRRLRTEPDLRFELCLEAGASQEQRNRRHLTLPVSLLLHAAVIALAIVVPLMLSENLPPPTFTAKAFFVEPLAAPPPPPPPPPPARGASMVRAPLKTAVPVSVGFAAPIDIPSEIRPEAGLDLGLPGGVEGGVEGGVPGGVVGGVVGGLPEAPPPAMAPVRVGGFVKEPAKIKHVDPIYPPLAVQARVQGIVIIEATIDAHGAVVDAKILRSLRLLDQAALDAVRQWMFRPTLLNGIPTPVILTVTVMFRIKDSTIT